MTLSKQQRAAEMVYEHLDEDFVGYINGGCHACCAVSDSKGFHDDSHLPVEISQAKMIALMHSELSEALEAVRNGNPVDNHIPIDGLTAEMADTVIRIFHFCGRFDLKLGDAIVRKVKFNLHRTTKHGKLF